ncbi:acyl carrier protein [Streptomyces caniscabiei]|uniref:acyl carrier protein n=1 Tax=Streptomyces TaxID=1883 RepID=UPI0029BA5B90|nr:acyl carrier protein [Streptomyces caniscabiei]MDX2599665.1 acyl carrier protein [Streptomyces caniscabiei]MDX2735040.1 acyl carrier protein [Streptomyces caniscabiei]MDX2776736.1 acyl carrier protein [Streptomyces caniscabiei]
MDSADKPGSMAVEELEKWLVKCVGEYVPDLDEPVDPDQQLGEYGLDSIAVVAFTADVEDRLGIQLEPTAVWDHPTVSRLARYLLSERERQQSAAA